jgi:UPF0716 protein FxsA
VALVLALLFVVVPVLELAVIIQVGSAIGVFNTIGLLLLSGLLGGWLMKREGLGVVRRMQRTAGEGRVPGTELVDAFLILFGGALMLAPGFLTDLFGVALMLPPVRAVVRATLRRRFEARVIRYR